MSDLIGVKKLNATLGVSGTSGQIIGTLATPITIHAGIGRNAKEALDYTGEYEVVSKIDMDETLDTAKKYLSQNIIVKAIPYAEVSNVSGGRTVTIGG